MRPFRNRPGSGFDPGRWPPLVSGNGRLKMLVGNRRTSVVGLAFWSALSGLTESAIVVVIVQLAANVARGATSTKVSLVNLHVSPGKLFLIATGLIVVRILLQFPLSILPARISSDVQSRLRRELFSVFTHASWEVQASDKEGYLQETLTGQVALAVNGALQMSALIISTIAFIILMSTAVALNAIAAGVIFVASIALFTVLRPLNTLAENIARELSRAQLAFAGGVSESGRVAEEAHVFRVGEAQERAIDRLIAAAQRLYFRSALVTRLAPALYQSSVLLVLVGALFILYKEGASHFATLGGLVLVVYRAGAYGQAIQSAYQTLRTSLPFVDRLRDTARRYAASTPPEGTEPLGPVTSVAFDGVTFGYVPERPVLKDISFRVDAGEAVGIVGPSGAGKSTLIQILLALRVPQGGRYLVNGTPAETLRREDWYSRISYVPQQPRLLHASVAENIRFMRDIDDAEVRRAAELARIDEDIAGWADGYDTMVGPRVDAVSGGQQQRICLARALAGRPTVLVLDEPTSALDPQSERLIQASLESLRHEMTLFIIAHRMSTLDICDRVMVIVDGRLAAFDTTDLLRESNPYYRSASLLAAGAPEGGILP